MQNVDGYSLRVETLKYHLSFKPILTTFEIKASLPKFDSILQAQNYLKFSHQVYLVFCFDGDAEALKIALRKNQYNPDDGIGVFFTKDKLIFDRLYESKIGNPLESEVDRNIEMLFSESDKEALLSRKYKYLIEEVFVPAIL